MRDDSPWDREGFRLKNIRIRRTVSMKIACTVVRKIACILATLAVNFILSSMNLQRIWEVGRGWGDQKVIGCTSHVTTYMIRNGIIYL